MAELLVILATGDDGRWHPGIGDPSVMGWLTVLAYAAGAFAAFRAHMASKQGAQMLRTVAPQEADNQRVIAGLWLSVTVLLVALGINKQLDLQSYFTEVLRDLAMSQGWYERRRAFQKAFILAMAGAAVVASLAVALFARRVVRRVWMAVAGVGFLLAFVVVRAASFHHMDTLLMTGRLRLNWLFELVGIALIAIAARRSERAVRPPS